MAKAVMSVHEKVRGRRRHPGHTRRSWALMEGRKKGKMQAGAGVKQIIDCLIFKEQ